MKDRTHGQADSWQIIPLPDDRLNFSINSAVCTYCRSAQTHDTSFIIQLFRLFCVCVCLCDGKCINSEKKGCQSTKGSQRNKETSDAFLSGLFLNHFLQFFLCRFNWTLSFAPHLHFFCMTRTHFPLCASFLMKHFGVRETWGKKRNHKLPDFASAKECKLLPKRDAKIFCRLVMCREV